MPIIKKRRLEEHFTLMFVDMGQGDCTIIKCPDGKVVMVDCGSSGSLDIEEYEEAKNQLIVWAGTNPIHAIIFTHPDEDHNNKTLEMLTNTKKGSTQYLKVDKVIFSMAGADSPMLNYNPRVRSLVCDGYLGTPELFEITKNDSNSYYNLWKSPDYYKEPISAKQPIGRVYNVCEGTTSVEKKSWSIDIIAGNVQGSKKGSTNTNPASLVTLITLGEEKILLMGDSTVETQAYLYKTYKDDSIKNVSSLQIPHHGSGSEDCFPTREFVQLVNPQQLLISVGLINDSYCLPRYKTIEAWSQGSRLADLKPNQIVDIDFWKDNTEAEADCKKFVTQNHILNCWDEKKCKYLKNESQTFFWLEDPDDAMRSTGFYGFKNTGLYIYRERTKKNIWETGIMGNVMVKILES